MKKISSAYLLPATIHTSNIVAKVLSEKHVFPCLRDELQSFSGMHLFLSSIERGEILVFAAYHFNRDIAGIVYGEFDQDGYFNAHTAYKRHVDAYTGSRLMEEALFNIFPGCKGVIGYIPEFNRASRLYAIRGGYRDEGIMDINKIYFLQDGQKRHCIKYIKDSEVING